MYIKNFSELSKDDAPIAGGKGASLGEMLQAGIAVPDGYVVLADTFDYFLRETDLTQEIVAILGTVDTDAIHTVEAASEKIQGLIKAATMPEDIAADILKSFKELDSEYVAVRSSATAEDGAEHAWAGQLSSYLNTTEDGVLEKVQDCWASLFTPRAIFYRFEKELNDLHISVAVVVQKMVNSEKSGIAFSVHPVTEDHNQIIIEAGLGLGEAIVSGAVTPDAYVITKDPREIVDTNINEQNKALYRSEKLSEEGWNEWKELDSEQANVQVLPEVDVLELAEQIVTIENHYGFPCDIEWAYEDGEFYITQSRPITTLQNKIKPESDLSELKEYPIEHYLNEPLFKMGVWALFPSDSMSWHGLEGSKHFQKKFGFGKGSLAIHVMGETPMQHMYIPVSYFKKVKSYILSLKKDNNKGYEEKVMEFYKEKQITKEKLIEAALTSYENVTDDNLIAAYRTNRDIAHEITTWDQVGWIGETIFDEDMKNILVGKGLVESSPEYHNALFTLTKPEEISTTLEEKRATLKAARDVLTEKTSLEDVAEKLAKEYGWMPVFTYGDPWDSKYFASEVTSLTKKGKAELDKEIAVLDNYSDIRNRDFKEVVEKYKLSEEEAQVFVDFGLMLDARNEAEYILSFAGFYLLPIYDEFAKRLSVEVDDLRRLTEDEMVSCLEKKDDIQKLLSERKEYFAWGFNESMSEIIFFTEKESKQLYEHVEKNAKRFGGPTKGVGICASPGCATGVAKVLNSPADNQKVQNGDILIAKATTVDYLPSMKRAAAFVTEAGGLTCHAAVVAREFGVPCVVSLQGATEDFADGDEVEVDADNAMVTLVKKKFKTDTRDISTRPDSVDWEKVLQRNFPPLGWTAGGYYEFNGLNVGPMTWIREREMHIKYKVVQTYMIQDPTAYYTSNISKLINEIDRGLEKAIDETNKKIDEMVGVVPGETLTKLKKLNTKHKLSYGFMIVAFDVVIDIKKRIDEVIKHKSNNLETYLATPWKPTVVQREQIELEEVRKRISENPDKKNELLEKMEADFGYIHQDYLGEPWNKTDYEKALSDGITLHSGMVKDFDDSQFSEYEKWLVSIFKKITYMYEEGRNAMVRCVWAMKSNAEKLGHNPDHLLYMTVSEIDDFCDGKQGFISEDLVNKRKEAFALHFDNGIYTEYSGNEEVEQLIKEHNVSHFWETQDIYSKELKGSIAYKGYAKGKARIVFTQEDSNLIEEGDILISPMTQVEFLSGIRKCAAIVTDEGGIISHAAIVSREFGKPCIIGTKIATKVLKDGDLVEVDADSGVVKLVKKNVIEPEHSDKDTGPQTYRILRSRKMFPFPGVWNSESRTQAITKKLHGIKIDTAWMSWKDGMWTGIFAEDEWQANSRLVAERLKDDRTYLSKIYQEQKVVGIETITRARKIIDSDLSAHTRDKLLQVYEALKRDWLFFNALNTIPWFVGGDVYESLVLNLLEKKYNLPADKIEKITTSPHPSFSHEEEVLLYEAALCESQEEKIAYAKKLESRFYWMPFGYDGPVKNTKAKYLEKIENIASKNKTDLRDHLERLELFHKNLSTEQSAIIKKYAITKADLEFVQQIYLLAEMTDWRKEVTCQIHVAVYEVLDHLSKMYGFVDQNELRFVSLEELRTLEKKDLQILIDERKEGHVHVATKEGSNIFVGAEAEALREKLYAGMQLGDTLVGRVGSRGMESVVKGTVAVVIDPNEIDKMPDDCILVSTMTTPEFVPAMRKARAIVTDEGGATCHAAIVARELGITCIIGTQNATQILKDGMEVEVDADNGIVRII